MLTPARSRTSPAPYRHNPPPASTPSLLLVPATQSPIPPQCLAIPLRLHVVSESLQVHGYKMYAVEKWIVERNRPVTVLVVYTGDPSHKISVFSLSPSPDLTPNEAQAEWDKAINHLRRDGARPKETPQGILMATSLAHFRSDYTIVHIPDGNFLAVREQLYTNINLLRMGCSGRSALTLEDPSDATKSRFTSTYHLPESICSAASAVTSTETLPLPVSLSKTRSHSHTRSTSVLSFGSPSKLSPDSASPTATMSKARATLGIGLPSTLGFDLKPSVSREKATSKDNSTFIATVLEFVKLIQAGLAIFGMYGVLPKTQTISPHLDGLLCDQTVDGIRRWMVAVGGPCVGVEPMERIADPTFVAALVSLVLSVRNKLAALGYTQVPRDPFLYPNIFLHALAAYLQSTNPNASNPAIISPPTTHQDANYGFGHPHTGGYLFPPYLHHLLPPHPPTPPQMTPSNSGSSGSNAHQPATVPPQAFLTRELVEAIGTAFDTKVRTADGRVGGHGGRMRKALREKLRAGVDSDGDADRGTTSGGEGGGGGIGIVGGDRGRERETVGGVGTGVSSSGGQILSGIGSFASGLGLGVGAGSGGGAATGAGTLLEPTCDMGSLVRAIYSRDGKGRAIRTIGMGRDKKGKEKRNDSVDPLAIGYGYAYSGKDKEKDGDIGLSVRALWSGQVNSILQLRGWEIERERMSGSLAVRKRERGSMWDRDRYALSDGDVDDPGHGAAKSETEEESDPAIQGSGFGGMWGERVQKKLEAWKFSRKRGNMTFDLATPKDIVNGHKYQASDDLSTTRPNALRGISLPLSPTLPPMVFVGGDEPDDDDLLSSGQVSPIDNLRPSPFSVFHYGPSFDSTSLTTNPNVEYERKVTEFNQKRPWGNRIPQNRVSSWADPYSARGLLDSDGSDMEGRNSSGSKPGRRKRGSRRGSVLGRASILSEEPAEAEDDEDIDWFEEYEISQRKREIYGSHRRRSFHDVESLRGMHVITAEHMRVDVELAGQILVMTRREEHLRNVLACLQVLTSDLSNTNTLLREDYQSHIPVLSGLEARAQVISTIDAENAKTDKTSQATHTLRYEAEQFHIPDLWHTIMPPRQKVLALREKVFGMGGRRLPPGAHGAHGRLNRLQWTLDGQERLVDHLGRTEDEAREEEPGKPHIGSQEEDEEEVVQHPGIKPMWLLRFFTSWGARWGTHAAVTTSSGDDDAGKKSPDGTMLIDDKQNGKDIIVDDVSLVKRRTKPSLDPILT